jgi:16S rRNA (uracil1498-N3)-methyltransferase
LRLSFTRPSRSGIFKNFLSYDFIMPIDRFFSSTKLTENKTILLEGAEARHLALSTRKREGERVELVDGSGTLAVAVIVSLEKKKPVELRLLESIRHEEPSKKIYLLQAVPRANRLDTIIEKATELGVWEIILFPGEEGERSLISAHGIDRLEQVAISAMKQSGRLFLPKIRQFSPIDSWISLDHFTLYGEVDPTAPSLISLQDQLPENISFVVGPESGFSEEEVANLKRLGARGVSLNPNILRTDTAAIAAVAILSHISLVELKNSPLSHGDL